MNKYYDIPAPRSGAVIPIPRGWTMYYVNASTVRMERLPWYARLWQVFV